MTASDRYSRGDGDLAGPVSRFLIGALPDRYRDDIAGDLIEEASAIAGSRGGGVAAKRWLVRQLLLSLPPIVSLHFRQREDDEMKHAKWIAAAALIILGSLQAWDSGVLRAPPAIAALVAAAIAIGVAGVFIAHEGIRFGIAILVFLMLFAARMASPIALPELTLIGFPIFLWLVLGSRYLAMKEKRRQPPGPGAAA